MNDNTRLRMLKAGIAGAETLAEAKDVISVLGLGGGLVAVPYSHGGGADTDKYKITCAYASTGGGAA